MAARQGADVDCSKTLCVFRSTVGDHEAKRPYGKLKRIDATGGPRHYTAEPADAGVELGLLRLVKMSGINGDKARFHRQRKHKLAKRERNRALREKVAASSPRRPDGRDL